MAAPKGPVTPQSGPLAGQTFPSYYRYQVARSQALYGQKTYAGERSVKQIAPREAMGRVTIATMQANGLSRREAIQEYARMRAANGNKSPTRKQVRNQLIARGVIDQNAEPDWDAAS